MPRTFFGTAAHLELIAMPGMLAAELAAHGVRKLRRPRPRAFRGAILRPGPDTPRWNRLAAEANQLLRRRGDKVKLARILGISRQRLHLLLKAKSACPDAERTLLLREWIDLRRRGLDLA
jgi:hypothetical protein